MSKRISKIIPSFLVDKASCTRQFESELSLHSLASLFPIKEGSTFLTKPLFPQGREDVTALRCSEPLRSKVGGPKRSSPYCAGWDRLTIACCSGGQLADWDRMAYWRACSIKCLRLFCWLGAPSISEPRCKDTKTVRGQFTVAHTCSWLLILSHRFSLFWYL